MVVALPGRGSVSAAGARRNAAMVLGGAGTWVHPTSPGTRNDLHSGDG